MEGFVGVTAMEVKVGAGTLTISTVEPEIDPEAA
jgi:hypothetical protein